MYSLKNTDLYSMPEEEEDQAPQNSFDPKLLAFFIRIIRTLFIGMFWMLVNIFLGLYLGFGLPEYSTPLMMGIFYTWLGLSFAGYVYFVWRMWARKK